MAKIPKKPVEAAVPAPPAPATVEAPQSFFSPRNIPLWASLVLAAVVAAGVWAKQQAGG